MTAVWRWASALFGVWSGALAPALLLFPFFAVTLGLRLGREALHPWRSCRESTWFRTTPRLRAAWGMVPGPSGAACFELGVYER